MNMVSTSVRIPIRIKEETEQLIQEGYFKNLSEAVVTGLRNEIKEYSPSRAVNEIREFRHKTWQDFLKQANGDYEKAAKLYDEAIDKSWKESGLRKIVESKDLYLKHTLD